jgi:hypothetical protein
MKSRRCHIVKLSFTDEGAKSAVMKLGMGIMVMAGMVSFAASARAEEPVRALEIPLPTLTTADAAGEPEWYRKFSFSSETSRESLLTSGPASDWGLAWEQGERWLISIDRTLREEQMPLSPYPRDELSAGAMFRITPNLSFGGEVSVGADTLDTSKLNENGEPMEAGIRLRSAFKF